MVQQSVRLLIPFKSLVDGDAWDVLEVLTGTLEAPHDWASEHDHYLYGTPKRRGEITRPLERCLKHDHGH